LDILTVVGHFVRYVGFSNAAGYLFHRGIHQPPTSEKTYDDIPENVDIITGMFAQEPKPSAWETMTDEEKDRETEKLFVLMNRLHKNGAIKMVPK
jgi:hypothetical protein